MFKTHLIYLVILLLVNIKLKSQQVNPQTTHKIVVDTLYAKYIKTEKLEVKELSSESGATVVKGNSKSENIISITYSGDGKLEALNGIGKTLKTGENLSLKVSISENKEFLKQQFKRVFTNHLIAISNLEDDDYKEILQNYYGITDSEIDEIKKSYVSRLYYINSVCGYYNDIAVIIPTFDIKNLDDKEEKWAKDLYSFTIKLGGIEKTVRFNQGETKEISSGFKLTGETKYSLRFEKPESKIISNSYKEIIKYLPEQDKVKNDIKLLSGFEKQLNNFSDEIIQIRADIQKEEKERIKKKKGPLTQEEYNKYICPLYNNKLAAVKNKIDAATTEQANLATSLSKYKEWIKMWLWYNTGTPSLNPFQYSPDLSSFDNIVLLNATKIKLGVLQRRKQYLDSVLIKFPMKTDVKEETVYRFSDTLSALQQKIETLHVQELSLQQGLKDDQDRKTMFQKESAADRVKDIFLYSGKLYLGKVNTTRCGTMKYKDSLVYRIHDANENFKLISPNHSNYDQDVLVSVATENAPATLSLTTVIVLVPETTITTEVLGPLFEQIASGIEEFTKSAESRCMLTGLDGLPALARQYNLLKIMVQKVSAFQLFQTRADSAFYRTLIKPQPVIDSNATSYLNKYSFDTGKASARFSYRVNKLYRFWPAAGFVYSYASRPEVSINSDGALKTTYFNGPKVPIGLKIHPFKASIMDPEFIYSEKRNPKFDYRKIYAFIGVNASNPAKEYFVGAGVDLWSGFSLTGGYHIIRKNQQKYEAGTVSSREYLDWNNAYIGINLDITLAVKAVQFFIKK